MVFGETARDYSGALTKVSDGYLLSSMERIYKLNTSMQVLWSIRNDNRANMFETEDNDYLIGGHDVSSGGHTYVSKISSLGEYYEPNSKHFTIGWGSLTKMKDENYLIVGSYNIFDGYGRSKPYCALVKIDSNRDVIWAKDFQITRSNDASLLFKDSEERYFILSHGKIYMYDDKDGTVTTITFPDGWIPSRCFQSRDGGYIMGRGSWDGNDSDIIIKKLSNNFSLEWEVLLEGSGEDRLSAIIETEDQGLLVGASSDSPAGGDKSENARNNSLDYWIIKLDEFGNKIGDKRYGGDASETLDQIIRKSPGEYMLIGTSRSGISGDKTKPKIGNDTDPYNDDVWLVTIRDDGESLPNPHPGTLNICDNFPSDFNNLTDPIREEIITIGGCPEEVIVSSGAKVASRASNYITIKPGVHIKQGASFAAKIGSVNIHACDPDFSNARLLTHAGESYHDTTKIEISNIDVTAEDVFTQKSNSVIFEVYPNPATNSVELYTPELTNKKGTVGLYQISGARLKSYEINKSIRTKIDISQYAKGVYYFLLTIEGKQSIKRLIIQ